MPLMDWEPRFDLGVAAMDAAHRGLVAAMNKIFELDAQGARKDAIEAAIQRLATLTTQHFAEEERYMEALDFPDLRVHKRIHVELLEKFTTLFQAFRAGTGKVDRGFFDFLTFWLRSHITGVDRQYAKHANPAKV